MVFQLAKCSDDLISICWYDWEDHIHTHTHTHTHKKKTKCCKSLVEVPPMLYLYWVVHQNIISNVWSFSLDQWWSFPHCLWQESSFLWLLRKYLYISETSLWLPTLAARSSFQVWMPDFFSWLYLAPFKAVGRICLTECLSLKKSFVFCDVIYSFLLQNCVPSSSRAVVVQASLKFAYFTVSDSTLDFKQSMSICEQN